MVKARDIDHIGIAGVVEKLRKRVAGTKVYISVDIDVLDPAFAPGTFLILFTRALVSKPTSLPPVPWCWYIILAYEIIGHNPSSDIGNWNDFMLTLLCF
jgi:hypothetical protein